MVSATASLIMSLTFVDKIAKFTNEVQENIFFKNKNKYFYVLLEVGNNFRSEAQRSYSDFQ